MADFMSIEKQSENTPSTGSVAASDRPEPIDSAADREVTPAKSGDRSPSDVVTLKDKSRELKDNPTPSFQEIPAPDPSLATTKSKIEELKSESEAEAKQLIPQNPTTDDRK